MPDYLLPATLGVLLAAAFVTLARLSGRRQGSWIAWGLVVAALAYLAFAVAAGEGRWIRIEATGVLVFMLLVYAARRFGFGWAAAGWAVHVAWDLGLHYFGNGAHIAPAGYPELCAAFDVVVAGYAAWATWGRGGC